jgi:hypothetical protein
MRKNGSAAALVDKLAAVDAVMRAALFSFAPAAATILAAVRRKA